MKITANKPKTLQDYNDELYSSVSYAPIKNSGSIVHWESPALQNVQTEIESVEAFSARGMKCVYGRVDLFGGRQPEFHLDMWKTKDERLLARFWSRGKEIDRESYFVNWSSPTELAHHDERWVPEVLRKAYDNWVICFMRYE